MSKVARQTAIKLASNFAVRVNLARRFERFNRSRGGVILAFHEISADKLAAQLAHLAEVYTFISLTEFVNRLREGKSTAGAAAITFDDGYGDVVEAAATLADKNKYPMTFYLPTSYLNTGEPYWYQELKPLLARKVCDEAKIGDLYLSLRDKKQMNIAYQTLNRRFRHAANETETQELLCETRRALIDSEERPAELQITKPISWQRVGELSKREELSFEAHSVNHLAISRLTKDKAREEMERCNRRIEEVTNRAVRHFCYPFGGAAEIGLHAPEIAREFYKSATTMMRGRCQNKVDLMMLPRIPLYEQDSEQSVALKVSLAR